MVSPLRITLSRSVAATPDGTPSSVMFTFPENPELRATLIGTAAAPPAVTVGLGRDVVNVMDPDGATGSSLHAATSATVAAIRKVRFMIRL